jgi:hypothetical protein
MILALLRNSSRPLILKFKENEDYSVNGLVYKSFWEANTEEQCAYLQNPDVDRGLVELILTPKSVNLIEESNLGLLIFSIIVNPAIFTSFGYRSSSRYIDEKYQKHGESYNDGYDRYLYKLYRLILRSYIAESRRYDQEQKDSQTKRIRKFPKEKNYILLSLNYLQVPLGFGLSYNLYRLFKNISEKLEKTDQNFYTGYFLDLDWFRWKVIKQEQEDLAGNFLLKHALGDPDDNCRSAAYEKIDISNPEGLKYYFSNKRFYFNRLDSTEEEKYNHKQKLEKENYEELIEFLKSLVDEFSDNNDFYALLGLSNNPSIPIEVFEHLKNRIVIDPAGLEYRSNRIYRSIKAMGENRFSFSEDNVYSKLQNKFSSTSTSDTDLDLKINHLYQLITTALEQISKIHSMKTELS